MTNLEKVLIERDFVGPKIPLFYYEMGVLPCLGKPSFEYIHHFARIILSTLTPCSVSSRYTYSPLGR